MKASVKLTPCLRKDKIPSLHKLSLTLLLQIFCQRHDFAQMILLSSHCNHQNHYHFLYFSKTLLELQINQNLVDILFKDLT
jgi:hypothetical protein